MSSAKLMIGGAVAGLVVRLRVRRREQPERAESEPEDEIAAVHVDELREELRGELERLARRSRSHPAEPDSSGWGEIKASRTRRERTRRPG